MKVRWRRSSRGFPGSYQPVIANGGALSKLHHAALDLPRRAAQTKINNPCRQCVLQHAERKFETATGRRAA